MQEEKRLVEVVGMGGTGAQQPFCPLEWVSVVTFFFLPRVPGVRREDLGSSWPFWFQLELDYSAAHGLHINEILHDTLIHTRPGRSGEGTAQKTIRRKAKKGRIPLLDNKISDAATGLVQSWVGLIASHVFVLFDWLEMAAGFCTTHVGKE